MPEPAGDLAATMAKLMVLGMPLYEVVRRTTEAPAQVLGMAGRLGTLRPAAEGDVTVLKLEDGRFLYRDCVGEERLWNYRLEPMAVVKGGRQYPLRESTSLQQ